MKWRGITEHRKKSVIMFILNLYTKENPRVRSDKGCTIEAIF